MWLDDVWIQFDFMTVKKLTRYVQLLAFMTIYTYSMIKHSDRDIKASKSSKISYLIKYNFMMFLLNLST